MAFSFSVTDPVSRKYSETRTVYFSSQVVFRENPHFKYNHKKEPAPEGLYRVVIIDNDYNTYQEVIEICMEALNITYEDGMKIALAVDNNGFAEVMHGSKAEAEKTAEIIRKIGIEVRVIPLGEERIS